MPKLIALICKKDEISDEAFKAYYEEKHAPLIRSIFPMLDHYKRTYLTASSLLHGEFTLDADSMEKTFSVITELGFNTQIDLDAFMEIAANQEVIETIREDESNFLISNKTIMYKLNN